MPLEVKICGLKTPAAVNAAIAGGAAMVGFVFFDKSPRCLTPALAGALGQLVPTHVAKVGLIVDADDCATGFAHPEAASATTVMTAAIRMVMLPNA